MQHPRIVAIDYGTRRVGVALTDPLDMFAQPHGTFAPVEIIDELKRLSLDPGIKTLLVGWPLTEEGEMDAMTRNVEAFIRRVKSALPGVTVVRRDERFTSEAARDIIRASGGLRRDRRDKGRVDTAAAALILQEYLDEQR